MLKATILALTFPIVIQELPAQWFCALLSSAASGASSATIAAAVAPPASTTPSSASAAGYVVGALPNAGSESL